MRNKIRKIAIYLMVATVFGCITSCGSKEEEHLDAWMIANLNALNAIRNNPEYKELQSPGNEGSIFYKVLQRGDGTDSIKYTSTVTYYHKGLFIADYPYYNIKAGDIFSQRLFEDGIPKPAYVSSDVINGCKTALQHMVKGDKWEIWIPYQLGYGRAGSTDSNGKVSIPGYSTLVFELEVITVKGIDD